MVTVMIVKAANGHKAPSSVAENDARELFRTSRGAPYLRNA